MALGENGEERSLGDDLRAAMKEIEEREASEATAAPEKEEAPAPEAEAKEEVTEPKADRGDGRDAQGRFLPKPKEGEETKAETQPSAEANQTEESQSEPQKTPASQEDQPPQSWRADEAQAWKDVPAAAKAAIIRREADVAKIAGQNDNERMFGREMADIFRPFVPEIQAAGANPQTALKVLLDNHNALRSNDPNVKLGKARLLLAQYGIDPAQLAQPDPNSPPPHVIQLQNEIEQLKARLANPQGQQFAPLPPSAEESNIAAEIEAFRANPAHPHFDAVGPVMGRLLETEAAPDLESAYQMAVAADPVLRSTATAPQRTQEEKTAAARKAASSVTGSPGNPGNPTPLTMRDELAEGLRSAGFSV
jgi:hypothetical protein